MRCLKIKVPLLLAFALLIINTGDAQNALISFSSSDNHSFTDFVETSDGGFLFVGSGVSATGIPSIGVVKTSADFNIQWSRHFNKGLPCIGESVIKTADDGFIIVGSSGLLLDDSYADAYILKIDAAGNEVWCKTLSGPYEQKLKKVIELNGMYYCAGFIRTVPEPGEVHAFLAKFNGIGDTLWTVAFEMKDLLNYSFGLIATSDAQVLLYGEAGMWYPYVAKIDTSGNVTWAHTLPTIGFSSAAIKAAIEVTDGFIVAGHKFGSSNKTCNYLAKISIDGAISWSKLYGDSTLEYKLNDLIVHNGNVYGVGVQHYSSLSSQRGTIFSADSSGNLNTFLTTSVDSSIFYRIKRVGSELIICGTGKTANVGEAIVVKINLSLENLCSRKPDVIPYALADLGGPSLLNILKNPTEILYVSEMLDEEMTSLEMKSGCSLLDVPTQFNHSSRAAVAYSKGFIQVVSDHYPLNVSLFTLDGREVFKGAVNAESYIDFRFNQGVYFFHISDKKGFVSTGKFICH